MSAWSQVLWSKEWKDGFDFQLVPHPAKMVGALWKQEMRVGWGFFNPEVALGYWLGTVVIKGLAGRMLFLSWSCIVFSPVCHKAGV